MMKYCPEVGKKQTRVESAAMCALSCCLSASTQATGSEHGSGSLG